MGLKKCGRVAWQPNDEAVKIHASLVGGDLLPRSLDLIQEVGVRPTRAEPE
jgi:hypothetical protein